MYALAMILEQYVHNRRPIPRPWGWDMAVFFVQNVSSNFQIAFLAPFVEMQRI